MLEIDKDVIGERFDKWSQEIRDSPEKAKVIDISSEFVDIMGRNIITITMGEDINDEEFEL